MEALTWFIASSMFLAVLGGFAISLLNLIELQNVPKDRRPNLKDWLYWVAFFGLPVLGGILAFIYEGDTPLTKIVAFHIGASAPLIIRSLATVVPKSFEDSSGA